LGQVARRAADVSLNIINMMRNPRGHVPVEWNRKAFKNGGCRGELDERKIV
jgi:hypothetical protein